MRLNRIMLYIFWFLHQTTTNSQSLEFLPELYIFWFLHQTTTIVGGDRWLECCISFDSYIKPQLYNPCLVFTASCISFDSYIKPQHVCRLVGRTRGCISFDSYIKPQPSESATSKELVVYLLIPTSNHNFCHNLCVFVLLYIFWFLHQTTT